MKFLPLVLLLSAVSIFHSACGNEQKINANDLTSYETSSQETMATLGELTQVIQTNLLAMTHPFQPVVSGTVNPDLPVPTEPAPLKNPFENLSEEQASAIKGNFARINAELNTLQTKSRTLMEALTQIQIDIQTLRKEMDQETVSENAKTLFAGLPSRLEEIKAGIVTLDQEVGVAQNKNLEFLNAEETLRIGASYLLANSTKI